MQVMATMRRRYASSERSGRRRIAAAQARATVREGRTRTSLRRFTQARRAKKESELAMAAKGGSPPSALLLEGHPVQPLRPREEDDHHDRERHRAFEEGALREQEDGDRLDVPDDQRADQAALQAPETAEDDDGEHGDERSEPHEGIDDEHRRD